MKYCKFCLVISCFVSFLFLSTGCKKTKSTDNSLPNDSNTLSNKDVFVCQYHDSQSYLRIILGPEAGTKIDSHFSISATDLLKRVKINDSDAIIIRNDTFTKYFHVGDSSAYINARKFKGFWPKDWPLVYQAACTNFIFEKNDTLKIKTQYFVHQEQKYIILTGKVYQAK